MIYSWRSFTLDFVKGHFWLLSLLTIISKHRINEEFVIRVIFYFGGSFLPLRQSKAFYKFGFFDGIFGDFQKKHEFATRIKNTSALPRDFMIVVTILITGITSASYVPNQ